MYNYVVEIRVNGKPFAIKIGETKDYDKRFNQIVRELGINRKETITLIPLYLFTMENDKISAKIFEDELRLYFLKKIGLHNGFKRDYLLLKGKTKFNKEKEIEEIKNKEKEFKDFNLKLVYNYYENKLKLEYDNKLFYDKLLELI